MAHWRRIRLCQPPGERGLRQQRSILRMRMRQFFDGWQSNARLVTEQRLSLLLATLCTALANLETWIALANHVDSATTTNNLAVRVAEFECADGRNNLHGS